jgi:hypothetical protein
MIITQVYEANFRKIIIVYNNKVNFLLEIKYRKIGER